MLNVMHLYRKQELLLKTDEYNMLKDEHVLQLIGMYRIFLLSADWNTLLQNACSLRKVTNDVLFVNSLVLALRDRSDTQFVIIPGLNEILPRLFYDNRIIQRVEASNSSIITLENELQHEGLNIFMLDTGMKTFCDQLAARFQLASIDFIRQKGTIRNISQNVHQLSGEQKLLAELLLHVLQQIMARMNMERFSLGLPNLSDNLKPSSRLRQNELDAFKEHSIDLDQNLILQKLNEFNDVFQDIGNNRLVNYKSTKDIDDVVGLVLRDKLVDIKRAVLSNIYDIKDVAEIPPLSNVGYFMSEPIAQATLEAVVRLTNKKREELQAYTKDDLELPGIKIHNITVDKLLTYDELVNVDMSNIKPYVIVQEKRLNHKDFEVKIELSSDKAQRVVCRLLMSPIEDGLAKPLSIENMQLNTMALHAIAVDLKPGQNIVHIRSNDIAYSMRDTTHISEIYRKVMLATSNELSTEEDEIYQQLCAFPHRLLLPRGRSNGLPMKFIAVISAVTQDDIILQQQSSSRHICSMGTSSLFLDNLPLLYPLDRKINNLNDFNVSNVMFKDVLIYHKE